MPNDHIAKVTKRTISLIMKKKRVNIQIPNNALISDCYLVILARDGEKL